LDKKLVLALFVIGAIAVGLFAVLVIGLFRVDEDGRSRDDGAPLPTPLLRTPTGAVAGGSEIPWAAPLRMFPRNGRSS
jgi:hypothetical protein